MPLASPRRAACWNQVTAWVGFAPAPTATLFFREVNHAQAVQRRRAAEVGGLDEPVGRHRRVADHAGAVQVAGGQAQHAAEVPRRRRPLVAERLGGRVVVDAAEGVIVRGGQGGHAVGVAVGGPAGVQLARGGRLAGHGPADLIGVAEAAQGGRVPRVSRPAVGVHGGRWVDRHQRGQPQGEQVTLPRQRDRVARRRRPPQPVDGSRGVWVLVDDRLRRAPVRGRVDRRRRQAQGGQPQHRVGAARVGRPAVPVGGRPQVGREPGQALRVPIAQRDHGQGGAGVHRPPHVPHGHRRVRLHARAQAAGGREAGVPNRAAGLGGGAEQARGGDEVAGDAGPRGGGDRQARHPVRIAGVGRPAVQLDGDRRVALHPLAGSVSRAQADHRGRGPQPHGNAEPTVGLHLVSGAADPLAAADADQEVDRRVIGRRLGLPLGRVVGPGFDEVRAVRQPQPSEAANLVRLRRVPRVPHARQGRERVERARRWGPGCRRGGRARGGSPAHQRQGHQPDGQTLAAVGVPHLDCPARLDPPTQSTPQAGESTPASAACHGID